MVAPSQPKPEEAGEDRLVGAQVEQHSDLKDDAKSVSIEESSLEKVSKQLKGIMVNDESSKISEMLEAFKLAAKTLERETRTSSGRPTQVRQSC